MLASREMAFDGVLVHLGYFSYITYAISFNALEGNTCSFGFRESGHSLVYIVAQLRVAMRGKMQGMKFRVGLQMHLSLIVNEAAIGDAYEPCFESCQSLEIPYVLPGPYEGLLCQVVGSHGITLCHAKKEAAHGCLMSLYEFGESIMATRGNYLSDENGIGSLHDVLMLVL